MAEEIERFLLAGVNAGLGLLMKTVPGGSVAADAGIDAGILACKMGTIILPRIKGGLTQEELDAIIAEFRAGVPAGTWAIALAGLKSLVDRTIGGSFKL